MKRAAFQTLSSETSAAHFSAPVKFGIRPRAPGKRATCSDGSSVQTASLISCLVTETDYLTSEARFAQLRRPHSAICWAAGDTRRRNHTAPNEHLATNLRGGCPVSLRRKTHDESKNAAGEHYLKVVMLTVLAWNRRHRKGEQ